MVSHYIQVGEERPPLGVERVREREREKERERERERERDKGASMKHNINERMYIIMYSVK